MCNVQSFYQAKIGKLNIIIPCSLHINEIVIHVSPLAIA